MLELFIRGRNHRTDAIARYGEKTGKTTVLKGTVVSEGLSDFGNTQKIEELRRKATNDEGVLTKDIVFDTPTLAAQFVCGYSVSGPVAWHIEKHKNLSEWIKENKES